MLSLQLKSGDYLTIGDDIAVQVFKQNGPAFRVEVKAPREIPVLRGSVLERNGSERPEGLYDHHPVKPSRRAHNARNLEAMTKRKEQRAALRQDRAAAVEEMQTILDRMDAAQDRAVLRQGITALRMGLARMAELGEEENNV